MKKIVFIFVLIVVMFFSCTIFSRSSLAADDDIVGKIEIPKISLNYTISSKATTESLSKNIVLLYGTGINKEGNSVLIGHNYKNGQFFSDIDKLKNEDYIYLTDTENNKIGYKVYNIFEASASDTSFYQRDTNGKKEITLSTLSNTNEDNRLIVVARETSDLADNLQEAEKNAFNMKFEKYEGIQKGSVVKSLIQEIKLNNAISDSKVIKINVDSSDIETSLTYKVKCNYDENGYVNEIVVEKETQNIVTSDNKNDVGNNSNKDSQQINSSNSQNSQNNAIALTTDKTTSKNSLPKAGKSRFIFGVIFIFLIGIVIFGFKVKNIKV